MTKSGSAQEYLSLKQCDLFHGLLVNQYPDLHRATVLLQFVVVTLYWNSKKARRWEPGVGNLITSCSVLIKDVSMINGEMQTLSMTTQTEFLGGP